MGRNYVALEGYFYSLFFTIEIFSLNCDIKLLFILISRCPDDKYSLYIYIYIFFLLLEHNVKGPFLKE